LGCHAANLHGGPDITCRNGGLVVSATTGYPQSGTYPQRLTPKGVISLCLW
jgi:hypothetical protein